jgi:hypothetical protein
VSSGEPGPITRLFLRALQRVGSRWWAFRASRPPSPQARCSCDQAIFPNPGITVLNYEHQPVPGAQVYVDGKYVGTTSAEPGKVGRIWPAEFTPCAPHLVTVIACDGSRATKTLGYWCYPSQGAAAGQGASKMLGQESVDNVIYVFTDKCGATGQSASANPPQECHCSPDQYQSIIVINNQRQLIPGAQVYIDGQYVGTTGSDVTDMGMISNGFTPCQWHDVKVIACDGTTASARLGFFCYPGNMYVYNVIRVPTDKCGGSMGYAGPI